MKLLIDSHILVWLLYEPERFTAAVKQEIESAEAVYVSAVSLWELAELHRAGKLRYTPDELAEGAEALGLSALPLTPAQAAAVGSVPERLKDMFDRMIAAQAQAQGCTIVTADERMGGAGLAVLAVR